MDFLKAWRREALRATGVGLLAPGAVLLALVLVAVGGGLGGVGSLGQLVGGPGIPAGEAAASGDRGPVARGTGTLVREGVPGEGEEADGRAGSAAPEGSAGRAAAALGTLAPAPASVSGGPTATAAPEPVGEGIDQAVEAVGSMVRVRP